MSETKTGQFRVAELAESFLGRGLDLSNDEVQLVDAWDRMTTDMVAGKFDLCVSSAYDSSTFDGLNRSLTDKYLSDDPAHAFELPSSWEGFGFGLGGVSQGYGWFDYADFEGLVLEDEEILEAEEFRQAVTSRRQGSMFGKQRADARPGRHATRRPMTTPVHRPDTGPEGMTAAQSKLYAELVATLPGQDEMRADPAWRQPYPANMGRTGSTLLTRPQRRASSMLTLSRPQRTQALSRAAQMATRAEQLVGPSATPSALAGVTPSFAPLAFDAFMSEDMSMVAGTPHYQAGTVAAAAEALAAATGSGASQAAPAMAARGMHPGASHRSFGPGGATGVMLDGLNISRQHFPALTGALDVAQAAFGEGPGAPRVGGVFNPGRMDAALKVVTMADPVAAQTGGPVGYMNLLYDAAEHTWIASDAADIGGFDAADAASTPRRAGKAVAPTKAAAQLVAQAMDRTRTPASPSRTVASVASGNHSASSATAVAMLAAPQSISSASVGPVVAPITGLTATESEAFALQVEASRAQAAGMTGQRQAIGAMPRASRKQPHGAARSQIAAQSGSAFSSGSRSVGGQIGAQLSLGDVIPSAAQHAETWAGTAAPVSVLGRVQQLAGQGGEGAVGAAQQSALGAASAIGAPGFTSVIRGGGISMSVTSTAAELFAARQMAMASPSAGSLVQPMDAPVTMTGEVRYGYGSVGVPMDDPALYVQLSDDGHAAGAGAASSSTGGLRKPAGTIAGRSKQMSSGVRAGVSSSTVPLSSVVQLQHALRQASRVAAGAVPALAGQSAATLRSGIRTAAAGALTRDQIVAAATGRPSRTEAAGARTEGMLDNAATPGASPYISRAVAGAVLASMGIPGSAAAALTGRHFDASVAQTAALAGPTSFDGAAVRSVGGARQQQLIGGSAVLRTADGVVSRILSTGGGTGFAPGAAQRHFDSPLESPSVPGIAGRGLGEGDPVFYEFSFDAETAFLAQDYSALAQAIEGGHVEVKNGRVVRSVPATPSAQRAAMVQPDRGTSSTARSATAFAAALPGVAQTATAARMAEHAAALSADGIVPGRSTPVVAGQSQAEAGYPALSLSTPGLGGSAATRVSSSAHSIGVAGVLAAATEAELAMLPPAVRQLVARHAEGATRMTSAGTDTGALLARLAAVSDPTAPGARTALLHQLAAMGVDTPELLRVLDEVGPTAAAHGVDATGAIGQLLSRETPTVALAAASSAEKVAQASAPERGVALSRDMAQIVRQLTGISSLGDAETTVEGDAYWGPYAPARMVRADATGLLKSLLGSRNGESRTSALAYGAELGELLAMEGRGATTASPAARAVAQARRMTSTGAPTQARRAALAERQTLLAERRQSLAERRATSAGKTGHTPTAEARIASERTLAGQGEQAQSQTESFVDSVAGAVAESLRGGDVSRATLAGAGPLGWDGDSLPLMAVTDDAPGTARAGQRFVERVAGSTAPWAASAGKSDVISRMGIQLGDDATAHPAFRALSRGAGDSSPLDLSMAALRGSADMGPIGEVLGMDGAQTGHGSRGFEAMGAQAISSILGSMPTRRSINQFMGGGMDLAWSVIDRANGAFAGLDAGVLRQMLRASADTVVPDGQGREIFPGMDDWGEALEMVRAAGFGGSAEDREKAQAAMAEGPGNTRAARAEHRVERLERRLEAASEAYGRQQVARGRGGRTPDSIDSLDWGLVETGAARDTPYAADLGSLANTMVRAADVPATEMSYVAPAVKVVAQQAQLKPRSEAVAGGAGGAGRQSGSKNANKPAKRVNYDALAGQIARRLSRRWALERDRFGKH